MKIELHILQNFPPANLNRDDTGSPKDCEFGGVRRARISSQCRKRSIRTSPVFQETLGENIAIRTKQSDKPLAKRLVEKHGFDEDEARKLARGLVGKMLGWDEAKQCTKVLFYVGYDELDRLAELIHEHVDTLREALQAIEALGDDASKKEREAAEKAYDTALGELVKAFTKETRDHIRAVDIALFGRMLAEVPGMNIDAACQVAHAISTNKVDMDFDYFTAVDDLNPKEETGAGMIGTTGFNSACFYSYALIDADQLAANLNGDRALAVEGIKAFLKAALHAIPSGKQNSFAAQTPPSLFMAVVRENGAMPWSLANAFVEPVRGPRREGDPGLVEASVRALDEHWASLAEMYGTEGTHCFVKVARDVDVLKHLAGARVETARAVIDAVAERLAPWSREVAA
ncbi:type I-E CRISPR-associated protein Cas7/Cse4/CasC [Rhodocaloribacter litoris]|uniref:type I-E CRISPR-associated protein Cas7/Cse4/CasC n=1 Tax=Rhodocaloribacter litoris TaxID=2558931 RepID=UPI001422FF97|nr:type I-E CRISPR-associated protein Cas7/Cse4/CasC [Rhodocaloribacter litoris]QXD16411.1 type I-E CRISPR-associated protein Cas7/Cse4/CasC [Rhodocaloribacter litoris]